MLHDWQNIWDESEVNYVNVPVIGEYNLDQIQLSEIENYINQNVDPKVKYTNIRMYLQNLFY